MEETLKNFIGVKNIKAKPMNRGDYNKYRRWTIPADENPEDEGYLVVYPDGYESWSPKKQFEDAYIELIKMTPVEIDTKAFPPGLLALRRYAVNGGSISHLDGFHYNNFHRFEIAMPTSDKTEAVFEIEFQKGPIKEVGINGITERDLLEILKIRMKNFQNSEFASPYNEKALKGIEMAIASLDARTRDREKRGVEGTNQK